ncbi:MAG: phosphotransferase, partial [Steroidobacteraceae bacterium]
MNVDIPLQVIIDALKEISPTIGSSEGQTNAIFISRILAQLVAHSKPPEVLEWEAEVPFSDFGGTRHYRSEESRLISELLPNWLEMRPAIAQMVRWESYILTEVTDRITGLLQVGDAAAAEQNNGAQYAEKIQAYLRTRFPNSPDLKVRSFKPYTGGSSKLSAALHVTDCSDLPTKLVFRQDRSVNVTGGPSVVNEFALLRRLHQLGLKVPKPHLLEASAGPMGSPFLIVSRVTGSPPLNDGLGLYAPRST